MRIKELTEEQVNKYINEMYSCFSNGYDFEKFLNLFLENLDLDEIEVTQKSRDGGIDLIALRNGIGEYSNADAVKYYIQAKRYKPGNSVGVRTIRELKGVIPFGHKGILITTSNFSDDAVKEANNDPSKPVTLIDGKTLLNECIKYGIGFAYEPIFSIDEFKKIMISKDDDSSSLEYEVNNDNIYNIENYKNSISKEITTNDVRARIISVPSKIASLLNDREEYSIKFENDLITSKFISGRNYFSGGITNIYRKYNLLSVDNIITPRKATWLYDGKIIEIRLEK